MPGATLIAAQVRFMWYAGEELGLLGSEHYVTTLNDTDVSPLVESRVGFCASSHGFVAL
jgi:hypothetical protein